MEHSPFLNPLRNDQDCLINYSTGSDSNLTLNAIFVVNWAAFIEFLQESTPPPVLSAKHMLQIEPAQPS